MTVTTVIAGQVKPIRTNVEQTFKELGGPRPYQWPNSYRIRQKYETRLKHVTAHWTVPLFGSPCFCVPFCAFLGLRGHDTGVTGQGLNAKTNRPTTSKAQSPNEHHECGAVNPGLRYRSTTTTTPRCAALEPLYDDLSAKDNDGLYGSTGGSNDREAAAQTFHKGTLEREM